MLELSWGLGTLVVFLVGVYFHLCGRAYCKAYERYMNLQAPHTWCQLTCVIGQCRAFMWMAYIASAGILAGGLADAFYFK